MNFLPEAFHDFISPQCNRSEFIRMWLKSRGVDCASVMIDGKSHVFVQFGGHAYNPRFRIKTVVAHYDRVSGSPGANDNSAAVWQIMNWAVKLKDLPYFHNVRIFFTDGEELGSKNGVTEQGAFGIASTFQRLGIKDDVFVFDSCGRGNVAVLSMLNLGPKTPKPFMKIAGDLHARAAGILKKASPKWMVLPVPYSDNASFLACGIPAVVFTLLPDDEASLYAMQFSAGATFERNLTSMKNAGDSFKEKLPLTWKLFHSEKDDASTLTQESFVLMEKILDALAEAKTPA